MVGAAGRMVASTILAVAVFSAGPGACADTQGGRLVPWRIERDLRRFNAVATDNVMELLAIRPGMTILDVGAGTGQFAYEFARRLNGTGRVYATDANEPCVDYMKREASRRGLGNLHPVLVKKDGVDTFYGKQKYDLITIFHVSIAYEDRVSFFRDLKGLLKEGGRLVLILYKIPTPFSSGDFRGDIRGLFRELSMEPEESPYSAILNDSTKERVREKPDEVPPEELKSLIVADFNETLADNQFAAYFSRESVFRKGVRFTPEERRFADWFLLQYPDNVVRAAGGPVRKKDIRIQKGGGFLAFSTINKLLILQRYRTYLKKDGLFLSGFTPSIRAVFEKAGYRLEREYGEAIPFEDMVVLSSRPPGTLHAP